MTNSNDPERTVDSRYVLRLIVVKVEGVLVPSPEAWNGSDTPTFSFDPDGLFPEWADEHGTDPDALRTELEQFARRSAPPVSDDLRSFLDRVRNHTPVRVGFLSGGPREWIEALETSRDLEDLRDLTFCYDDYPHGSRRTLLQFLMNRFIAGKGRTLLLGNTPADETLARTEKTRFRSLTEPSSDCRSLQNWGWDLADLQSFVDEHQPNE
jgi:hypothetical protein